MWFAKFSHVGALASLLKNALTLRDTGRIYFINAKVKIKVNAIQTLTTVSAGRWRHM